MKIPDGISLIDFTNEYKEKKNVSNAEIADKTGVSRTLVSRYLGEKYESNPEKIEKAIIQYFENLDEEYNPEEDIKEPAEEQTEDKEEFPVVKNNKISSFYESRDAVNIVAVCGLCQENISLGVIVGKSGYGKTHTLKQYAKKGRVCYIECDDSMTSRDLVDAVGLSVGIPRGSGGTVWSRVQAIKDFFDINEGYLLIIDEADKLLTKYSAKKMEIIRTIFDQCRVGLVVAGEPALESMLKLYLPRFANRADYFIKMKGLADSEIRDYLKDLNASEEVLEIIISRGTNAQTGCFRLLNRTLKNILRIKTDNSVITKKDLNIASNMMML